MLNTENPAYIPIVLPSDGPALEHLPAASALMLSAVYGVNPRLEPLVRVARERAQLLLVDPKTAHFQFEGHMSMPDYQALPYSPGRGALGTLWEPSRFSRAAARDALIGDVFDAQRKLGADMLLAPYFYIPHPQHAWVQACRAFAEDAMNSSPGTPVGVPICVDIDAIIEPGHLETVVAAYRGLRPALFWLTIVNFDERRADPRDLRTVVTFLRALQADGVPVVLSHVGRAGLLAIACGAAGFAAGTHGLETYPRALFREMMGTRPANSYYLHECYIHLPVHVAQACLELDGPNAHPTCGCAACDHQTTVTRMISRRLSLHSMVRRFMEVDDLRSVDPDGRCRHLIERFSAALQRAPELSEAISTTGTLLARRGATNAPPIRDGDFHYLEVLREAAGGPAATIPREEEPD